MKYFIDTSFMVGLANSRDKYHEKANKLLKNISYEENSELYLSDYVIDEFLSIILKGRSIKDALEWGKFIFSEEIANIIYGNKQIISSAWVLFQQEKDERKPLNFTDCIVYIKSKLLKCDEILTFDTKLKTYSST